MDRRIRRSPAGGGRPTCCWPSGRSWRRRDGRSRWRCPAHLSVSQLVVLRRDPQALARALRRPLPSAPEPVRPAGHRVPRVAGAALRRGPAARRRRAARRGRRRRGARRGAGRRCRRRSWPASGPTGTPVEVEVPFATVVAGVVVRGRMDAVFADPGGRYDVVDWKTGPAPDRRARPRRPRCSSRRTGWPGPSWPGCRCDRVGRPSTTCATGRRSARRTCWTPPG